MLSLWSLLLFRTSVIDSADLRMTVLANTGKTVRSRASVDHSCPELNQMSLSFLYSIINVSVLTFVALAQWICESFRAQRWLQFFGLESAVGSNGDNGFYSVLGEKAEARCAGKGKEAISSGQGTQMPIRREMKRNIGRSQGSIDGSRNLHYKCRQEGYSGMIWTLLVSEVL
jgi:hypothetical protein